MNNLEFRKALFESRVDALVEEAISKAYFDVCNYNTLREMSNDKSAIYDCEEYRRIQLLHVMYFNTMSDDLRQELDYCCAVIISKIRASFHERPVEQIKKKSFFQKLFS